jgi:ATP-dependent Clp protease ATP-binding subunit ClpA
VSQALEEAIRTEVMKYLKRPEIYNRVDDKVVFRPFSADTYGRMVARKIEAEARVFADQFGVRVKVDPGAIDWLAELAVEARREGARCVPRLTNRYVVAPVIDLLTSQESSRITSVVVSRKGEGTVAEEVRAR